MFNKSKKHININKKVYVSEGLKSSEKTISEFIGQNNIQKWNDIKSQLFCKSDEEFVTKLLNIAQDFLNR